MNDCLIPDEVDGPAICDDCGQELSHEEAEYYEYRCESCEKAWHEEIQALRPFACPWLRRKTNEH